MEEVWKDIAGYEGLYQVSNFGRVKSFQAGKTKILCTALSGSGYPFVALYKNKKSKQHSVHRLVAQAFIPNPKNKREVNHINGSKTDNRVENLEWVTSKENMRHAVDADLIKSGQKCRQAKLTDKQVFYIRENPDKLIAVQLAEKFQVCVATISQVQRGLKYKKESGKSRPTQRRLTAEQRNQVRTEYVKGSKEFGCYALAKKFGVKPVSIWQIVNEK